MALALGGHSYYFSPLRTFFMILLLCRLMNTNVYVIIKECLANGSVVVLAACDLMDSHLSSSWVYKRKRCLHKGLISKCLWLKLIKHHLFFFLVFAFFPLKLTFFLPEFFPTFKQKMNERTNAEPQKLRIKLLQGANCLFVVRCRWKRKNKLMWKRL